MMLGGEREHEQVQVSMESRDTPELGWGDVIHRRWSSAIQKSILVWTASTLLRPFHLGHGVCSTLLNYKKSCTLFQYSLLSPFWLSNIESSFIRWAISLQSGFWPVIKVLPGGCHVYHLSPISSTHSCKTIHRHTHTDIHTHT